MSVPYLRRQELNRKSELVYGKKSKWRSMLKKGYFEEALSKNGQDKIKRRKYYTLDDIEGKMDESLQQNENTTNETVSNEQEGEKKDAEFVEKDN